MTTALPGGPRETWVYESLIGALPIQLSPGQAMLVQFAGFETAVLALGWWYNRPAAAIAGTVAVVVAAVGSAGMLVLGSRIRALNTPAAYYRLLFGSSIELVLGLLAFLGLITYLFIIDPTDGTSLLGDLLGTTPPAPAVFVMLLILWDVCYRIGTGWWAAVTALYRSAKFTFDPATARAYRRLDLGNAAFAAVQLALVPLLRDQVVLAGAVIGHVLAVGIVVSASLWLARPNRT